MSAAPIITDFEAEGDQVSIDYADGRVEVVSREQFLSWLNAGRADAAEPAQTWTFVGHYSDADEIVIEYIMDGDVQDRREDTGFWQGGLFAEAASGLTQEDALDKLREKYEHDED